MITANTGCHNAHTINSSRQEESNCIALPLSTMNLQNSEKLPPPTTRLQERKAAHVKNTSHLRSFNNCTCHKLPAMTGCLCTLPAVSAYPQCGQWHTALLARKGCFNSSKAHHNWPFRTCGIIVCDVLQLEMDTDSVRKGQRGEGMINKNAH